MKTATWTQSNGRQLMVFVYPEKKSPQREPGYVVVSKQPDSRYVFSVKETELAYN